MKNLDIFTFYELNEPMRCRKRNFSTAHGFLNYIQAVIYAVKYIDHSGYRKDLAKGICRVLWRIENLSKTFLDFENKPYYIPENQEYFCFAANKNRLGQTGGAAFEKSKTEYRVS